MAGKAYWTAVGIRRKNLIEEDPGGLPWEPNEIYTPNKLEKNTVEKFWRSY